MQKISKINGKSKIENDFIDVEKIYRCMIFHLIDNV